MSNGDHHPSSARNKLHLADTCITSITKHQVAPLFRYISYKIIIHSSGKKLT